LDKAVNLIVHYDSFDFDDLSAENV
jgi:hypothetical protein